MNIIIDLTNKGYYHCPTLGKQEPIRHIKISTEKEEWGLFCLVYLQDGYNYDTAKLTFEEDYYAIVTIDKNSCNCSDEDDIERFLFADGYFEDIFEKVG